MPDYAADVRSLILQLAKEPVPMGWSIGGLVAMMAAEANGAGACIGLEPSPPASRVDTSAALRTGEFGAEEYGIASNDLDGQPAMPDLDAAERAVALSSLCRESRLARDERKAGIVIGALACPVLLVSGSADGAWSREWHGRWPHKNLGDALSAAEAHSLDGASHWGLILSKRVVERTAVAVLRWLEEAAHRRRG